MRKRHVIPILALIDDTGELIEVGKDLKRAERQKLNDMIDVFWTRMYLPKGEYKLTDFEDYDYLIAMEQYNLRNIRREFGVELAERVTLLLDYTDKPGDIDDPWYTGNFEMTYREIMEGCTGFLKELNMI